MEGTRVSDLSEALVLAIDNVAEAAKICSDFEQRKTMVEDDMNDDGGERADDVGLS